MIESSISNCILTVGPEYRNHRGGMGAVIEGYSKEFKTFHFLSTYKPLNKFIGPFYSLTKLLQLPVYLLLNQNIKIVHIHGTSKGSFYRKYIVFIIAKYIFRRKVVYHMHGGGFPKFYRGSNPLLKNLIKDLVNRADTVICLSESWRRFFLNNFNPRKLEVIPNVVEAFPNIQSGQGKNEKVVFLFLGKIWAKKGVYDFIDVSKQLLNSYSGSFEVWIGGYGEVKTLSNLIKEKELDEVIKYFGWVSGESKADLLKGADIFLLPSYYEALPVSILEAMAYGMPVISTKVGGIPELVQDKDSGFLIEPGDKEALKAGMEAFLKNRSLINEMGRKSFEIIEKGYTTEVAFQKLNDLYKELLSEGTDHQRNKLRNKEALKYAAR